MLLYVSGPMSSYPDHNFPAFAEARDQLRAAGYDVVCPAELGQVPGWQWGEYLRRDLAALVQCDAVARLDGWTESRGARLEVHVADELGMPSAHWLEWVWAAES